MMTPEEGPRPRSRTPGAAPRPWSFSTTLASEFDSNITQDTNNPVADYGVTFLLGTQYSQHLARHRTLTFNYEVAKHTYAQTNLFTRVSNHALVSFNQRLTRHWDLESIGEISLKGSDYEDHDVFDQYVALQRISYHLNDRDRLRLDGAYRLRRYGDTTGRDGMNRFVGFSFRERLSERSAWNVGYRYEANRSEEPRHRYLRRSVTAAYDTGLGPKDVLALSVQYRPRKYEKRVDVRGMRVPRVDNRWDFHTTWTHLLRRALELRLDYLFEPQTSNDPDKKFRDHIVTFSVTHRW
jgi:hypothetical protein